MGQCSFSILDISSILEPFNQVVSLFKPKKKLKRHKKDSAAFSSGGIVCKYTVAFYLFTVSRFGYKKSGSQFLIDITQKGQNADYCLTLHN